MKRFINYKPEIKPIKNKLKKVFKKSINTLRNFSLLIIIFQTIVILSIAISEPVALRIILGKLSRRILWSFDTLEIKDYGNYLKDFLIVLNPLSRELDRVDININFKNLQGLDCSREFNSYSTTNKIEGIPFIFINAFPGSLEDDILAVITAPIRDWKFENLSSF